MFYGSFSDLIPLPIQDTDLRTPVHADKPPEARSQTLLLKINLDHSVALFGANSSRDVLPQVVVR
jgi:hypothetical protein